MKIIVYLSKKLLPGKKMYCVLYFFLMSEVSSHMKLMLLIARLMLFMFLMSLWPFRKPALPAFSKVYKIMRLPF